MSVSCGKCAHCKTRKRDEYSFRTYWHTKQTIDNGGYVLFDTLTYDNDNLPHISDFVDINKYGIKDHSCFNREHYKLFFKRLRRRIQYTYGLTEAITYFFSTEYGEDDRYTHRPHYHILLFVKNKVINPVWLSYTISECWEYGRTDGLNFKPLSYVAKHIYGYDLGFGSNNEAYTLRAVTHYVAKYIMKNNLFQYQLVKRLKLIDSKLPPDDDTTLPMLKRQIDMFHQQSQGFGLGYLDYLTEREIEALKTDEGLLPDKDKVIKSVPLPMYYLRKLYYDNIKLQDGRRVWVLNENGINHKTTNLLIQINKNVEQIKTLLANVTQEQTSHFNRLLSGREIFDYVVYNVLYRGRLRHYNAINFYNGYSQDSLCESEQLDTMQWQSTIHNCYFNNTIDSCECAFVNDDKNVIISNYYGDDIFPSLDPYLPYINIDVKDFVHRYTFNQNSDPKFKNFDVLTEYINYLKREKNKYQQSTYDTKIAIADRLKTVTKIKESYVY